MRRSEIAALDWSSIDFERAVLRLALTKNGAARVVPLTPEAIAALRSIPRHISGRVFSSGAREISRAFLAATRRAGLADFVFHDLRHEATSRLFERGLSMIEVAAVTGHRTLQMLKRYSHPRAEDIARKLASNDRA